LRLPLMSNVRRHKVRVPIGVEGQILNSDRAGHVVTVADDNVNTGGFLVVERWPGSNGPNAKGAFDSWVQSEADLEKFFAEAGWKVAWRE
jgi:hypothetical protein